MSKSSSLHQEIVNELQIIFIYDRLSCRREEDDPSEAILYFHPPEIPEEKRVAICGQLMGVTHFLLDAFSAPNILTLANGKFAIRTFGNQYVLALGCSTATPDWFLDKQADILYQLTRFFHSDIQSVLSRVDGDRALLSKKLTIMMEHYIPISQRHGDLFALTFGILPILYLPKTANGISIQASLILQTCLMQKGVLGGMIMYQNKVVAVELGQDLAQKLAFIQPYRMPPADTVKVDFKLPMGVQLLVVYLTQSDLEELKQNSTRFQHPSTSEQHTYSHNNSKDRLGVAINSIQEEESSPSDISSNISSAAVSEELFNRAQVEVDVVNGSFVVSPVQEKDVLEHLRQEFDANRIEEPKMYLKSSPVIKRKFQSLTEYSIAHLSCQHLKTNASGLIETCHRCRSNEDIIPFAEEQERMLLPLKKYSSLPDPMFPFVRCDGKSMSHFLVTLLADATADSEIENESLDSGASKSSISDDDQLTNNCSKSLIQQKRDSPVNSHDSHSADIPSSFVPTPSSVRRPMHLPIKVGDSNLAKKNVWSNLEDMISTTNPIYSHSSDDEIQEDIKLDKVQSGYRNKQNFPIIAREKENTNHSRYLKTFRKLSSHDDSSSYSSSENENSRDVHLYSSATASAIPKIQFVGDSPHVHGTPRRKYANSNLKNKNIDDTIVESEDIYTRASIFMYCFGTMRLLIVLDPKCEDNLELINALWGYGSSSIIDLKEAVTSVEEQSYFSNQNDPYCFLRYESVWKSLAHGGKHEVMDFNTVQLMHQDFTSFPNIHELIIRGEDHVVYGYQCVGSEVYYQQSAGVQPGLPMPSDLMGKVPQKAKRRLERDHSILIL